MKNIYFLQIQNLIDGSYFLPTASGYLYSYCFNNQVIKDNYHYKGTIFLREDITKSIQSIEQPDILCISTYVWNFEYSKVFAKTVKEKWPQTLIIMGGPQVPYKPNFQDQLPFVDLVASYEGEEILKEVLLENLKPQPNFDSIEGLITPTSKTVERRKRIKGLETVLSPCLNGYYDQILNQYSELSFNLVIESNRGCPYSCTFCDMQENFYQKITQFPLSIVFSELEWASKNKIKYVDCADSNFGILKRDISIAKKVSDLKKEYGYPRFFNFTSAKNQPVYVKEIQRILSDVGIDRGISISLQSFDANVQKNIKRYNQPKDELKRKIEDYKSQGLHSFVEIILGLPGESKATWIKGISELLEIDYSGVLLIHPLSIVPNTPFADPNYIDQFELIYTVTRSPAQGFNYGTESAEERETLCIGSNSMTPQEWQSCYIFSKCLVGAGYYHGIFYFLSEYLKREHGYTIGNFFSDLLNYSEASSNFCSKHYNEIISDLKASLYDLRPFGRQVLDDGFYWSDQAAAAIVMLKNFDTLYEDVFLMLKDRKVLGDCHYNLYKEIQEYTYHSLENPYLPSETNQYFSYNLHSYFINKEPLLDIKQSLNFRGRAWESAREHALHIYWYGRKSRRCFKEIKEL